MIPTPFTIGSFYSLTYNKYLPHHRDSCINCTCTYNGIEKDCDGEVNLAVFSYHGDGEIIRIDMDFLQDWSITPFAYPVD